jgi:hypothetical protein
MADDAAPELVAERLLEFCEVLRRAAAPPRGFPKDRQAQVTSEDIRIRQEPPPSTQEEVLATCAADPHLSGAERSQLVHLIDKLNERDPATAFPVEAMTGQKSMRGADRSARDRTSAPP